MAGCAAMRTPLVVVCLVLGCASAPSQPQAPAAAAKEAAPAERGLDLSSIDRTVKPGDDFFRYAHGAWSNGGMLTEVTAKRASDLIQQAAQGASSAEAKKIGDTYASFMDEDAIEA